MNAGLLYSIVAASLGYSLLGLNTVNVSGLAAPLARAFALSPFGVGVSVSAAPFATAAGLLLGWRMGRGYSRRLALRVCALTYVAATIGVVFSWNWLAFLFFRMIGGAAIGWLLVVGALYLAETVSVETSNWRMLLFPLAAALGVVWAYASTYLVDVVGIVEAAWRWKLAAPILPAYLLVTASFGIVESPVWLARRASPELAREALVRLGETDPDGRMTTLLLSETAGVSQAGMPLFSPRMRSNLYLAVSLGAFSQLNGTGAIFSYLHDLLLQAGFSQEAGGRQAVVLAVTYAVVTVIGARLMNRLERKETLLAGPCGTAACLGAIAAIYYSGECRSVLPFLMMMFLTFAAFSQAVTMWVYVQELFPKSLRTEAQGLTLLTSLVAATLTCCLFPVLAAAYPSAPLIFFALMSAVNFLVVLLSYPETSRLTAAAADHDHSVLDMVETRGPA